MRLRGTVRRKSKAHGIRALYYKWLYYLGVFKRRPKVYGSAFATARWQLNAYIKQFDYVAAHNIKTRDDVEQRLRVVQHEISGQIDEREEIRAVLRRLETGDAEIQEQLEKIEKINAQLKKLRTEAKLCVQILEQQPQIKSKIDKAHEVKTFETERGKENGRTSDHHLEHRRNEAALRGSKEVLAAHVAAIRYSADKMIPARKCRDFLTSTSEVRFISMSDEAIETFKKAARPYGLRYLHLHDSNGDGLSTLMVRGEDAAVINRLIERNKLAVLTDVTQAEIERDPSKAADVNELPEVVIGKDQVRVQDAVKEARGSAQDLLKPEPNPTKGQTERKSRLSSDGLKTSVTEQEAEELWADVTASIDKDFAERIEEKRQHNFELYNQDDPLLGEKVVKTKRTVPVQDKPSVMKKLEAAKNVNTQKEARIAEAVRQMQAGGRTSNTDKVIQKTPKVKPQKLRR